MKDKKEYKVICIEEKCKREFIAFSKKALRCPKCKEEHLRITAHARYVEQRHKKKRRPRKLPPMSINDVVRATARYNKKHNTCISEGLFVSMMERGLIDVGEN